MAWLFESANGDWVKLNDGSYTDLPDGDWTIAGWMKRTDTSGFPYEWLISTGDYTSFESYHLFFNGTGHKISAKGLTDGDDWTLLDTGSAVVNDTDWHHICYIRSGETITVYVDNTSAITTTLSNIGASAPTTALAFAARNAASPVASRYFDGAMAEWAFWSGTAQNSTVRAALLAGAYPSDYSTNLTWYVGMDEDPTSSLTEEVGGYTLTNNGASETDHPPVFTAGNESQVPAKSLTLATPAPSISTTEKHISNVPAKSLTITGQAPQIVTTTTEANTADIPAASLTVATPAPSVSTTEKHIADIPAASLSVTTPAPSVATTEKHIADIPAATLTITGQAPQIVTTAGENVEVPAKALTVATPAPSIATTEKHISEQPVVALTLVSYNPSVTVTGDAEEEDTNDAISPQYIEYWKRWRKAESEKVEPARIDEVKKAEKKVKAKVSRRIERVKKTIPAANDVQSVARALDILSREVDRVSELSVKSRDLQATVERLEQEKLLKEEINRLLIIREQFEDEELLLMLL